MVFWWICVSPQFQSKKIGLFFFFVCHRWLAFFTGICTFFWIRELERGISWIYVFDNFFVSTEWHSTNFGLFIPFHSSVIVCLHEAFQPSDGSNWHRQCFPIAIATALRKSTRVDSVFPSGESKCYLVCFFFKSFQVWSIPPVCTQILQPCSLSVLSNSPLAWLTDLFKIFKCAASFG